jgi:EAL domain-containing protein (putative c-di-GMP-specific phosphodiesterase class I)
VRIAINDFGSGYANHSDLQRLPLDFLIVDKGSLAASDEEDYRNWLLQTILVLGRDLSLTVIAKGVESYEEMITLQSMGCTMAQGPFLGEPAPAEAVVERLLDSELPAGVVAEPGPMP